MRGIQFLDSLIFQDGADHLTIAPKAGSDVILSPSGAGRVNVAGAYKLPIADGVADRYLKTDGAGVVSWAPGGAGGTDPDAVHVNVPAEIHVVTDVAPAPGDEVILEDANDSWNKKRCQLSDIPALGAPAAHTHLQADITDLVHLDPNAIHDGTAGEIHAVADKAAVVDADEALIEDSADSYNKKRVAISTILLGAIKKAVAGEIHAITAKTAKAGADEVLIEDSADSYNKKRMTITNLLLGFIANVVEDTTPELGGPLNLNKQGIYDEFTAGENLALGDCCYYKDDGKMWKADADAIATCNGLIAIATDTILADAEGIFCLQGRITNAGWHFSADVGKYVYVHTTAGALTPTKPSGSGDVQRPVATILAETILFVHNNAYYQEVA